MKPGLARLSVVGLSLIFIWCDTVCVASRYAVVDLGVLPGSRGSCACGLNNIGQVVGFNLVSQSGAEAYPRAFVWAQGQMQDLGTAGTDQASVARRINDAGYIVGWSEQIGVRTRAVLWVPDWNGWYINNLGTLGGLCSAALDLNKNGWVVGWSDTTGNTNKHAFLWVNGWLYDLGALPEEPNTFAHAINNVGSTIVGMASTGGTNPTAHAVVFDLWWQTNLMPDNPRNSADDINDNLLVVGYYTVTNGTELTRHACVWDLVNQTMTGLGVLPSDNASRAIAVNTAGKVVGLSWFAEDPFADPPFGLVESTIFHPFLFDPATGTIANLNDLIPTNSVYVLNWVCDINDSDWIAGSARVTIGATQQTHAVVLVPDPTIIRHPTNQYAPLGGTANFTVQVIGTEPLAYQWWKDNSPVNDATNSVLVLTNLQAGDAGMYYVVVTNQFGSITSKIALLTINLAEVDPVFSPHINGSVYAFAVQPDGKVIVAGQFDLIGGVNRTNIARLNPDGTVDLTFDVAMPAYTMDFYNTYINSVVLQPDCKIVFGGFFDSVAGQPRTNIARVLPDGTLDLMYRPSVISASSPEGVVSCMALQPDGKLLVGGAFTEVSGVPRTNFARLNLDGSVDPDFSPVINGLGGADSVYAIAIQPDGKIIIGGDFYYVNDEYQPILARLNTDGTLDAGFAPEISGGEWPSVHALAVQDDGKILVGGWFYTVNGEPRTNIVRLNTNGSVDSEFALNVNGSVAAFSQQTDGDILFIGTFTKVNDNDRYGIARVTRTGLLDPTFAPMLGFAGYGWCQIDALAIQPDGKILLGGNFDIVGGQTRTNITRLLNTVPAVEQLSIDGLDIVWTRTGSCPEVWCTTFDYSVNGQTWHYLGAGTRRTNGWCVEGVSLPAGSMIRARGQLTGGRGNGSSWFVEKYAGAILPIQLTVRLVGSEVVLSWTGGQPPYQVQKTTELNSSNLWVDVGGPIWTNTVILPLEPGSAFLRVYGRAQ